LSLTRLQVPQANGAKSLGLGCSLEGLTLAGVPLLRITPAGFSPRPASEIGALMKGAYGLDIDPAKLVPGLDVVAEALNRGDLGRAMIAAVHLRLPPPSEGGARRVASVADVLAKYDPNEPRDARGRWTTGGASGPDDSPRSATPQPAVPLAPLKPILVSNPGAANEQLAEHVCEVAGRHCAITALQDKSGRPPYLSLCQAAEETRILVLHASKLDPIQDLGVIFPDKTVVKIIDGTAAVTYVNGVKLPRALI